MPTVSARSNCSQGPEEISGPWLEIDLEAITHNVCQIRQIVGTSTLMPVIKANAYGHGLVNIGRHLERLDVYGLCVGSFSEALSLRQNKILCPLLNLGLFSSSEAKRAIADNISLVLFDNRAEHLNTLAAQLGKKARVHVKIDTGLGRVGVNYSDGLTFLRRLHRMKNVVIDGIYTSLTEDISYDRLQLSRFTELCTRAEAEGIHLGLRHAASSAGILSLEDAGLDMVRPGIMIFGCYPSRNEGERRRIDLKPALSLKARVAWLKQVEAGDGISYHHTYRAKHRETIITGGIGYSDGYPPGSGSGGVVLIGGRRYSLVASVTANHIYIAGNNRAPVKCGDEIVLIGSQGDDRIPAELVADHSGLSDYQLLCGLNPNLPRYYSSASPGPQDESHGKTTDSNRSDRPA